MSLKTLPVDSPSFSSIRKEDYLYADKTKYISQMIKPFKYVFLSRPRRFGKSLLLNTIEELFLGHRELFEGLWIEKSGYDFKKHPVVQLSMTMTSDTSSLLATNILTRLETISQGEEIDLSRIFDPGEAIFRLVNSLNDRYKEKVVVLIDEYDKPIMDHLDDLKLATENRNVLRAFYVKLKDLADKLRFVFVTGVTKFAQTAIASAFNNLEDITLNPDFAGICGFTLDEFDALFSERLPDLLKRMIKSGDIDPSDTIDDLRKQILNWYDGYSWTGVERVLNPFSILKFFSTGNFQNFWYHTGSPFFLSTLIKQNPEAFFQHNLDSYLHKTLARTDLGQIAPIPLLFQTGYLTIDRIDLVNTEPDPSDPSDKPTKVRTYKFKTPNREVKDTYQDSIVMGLYNLGEDNLEEFKTDFRKALSTKNAGKLETIIGTIFAKLSYHQKEADIPKKENYYHSVLQAFMEGMFLDVRSKVASAKGRSDLEVILPGNIYVIIEIKYTAAKTVDANQEVRQKLLARGATAALNQIRKKDYSRKHQLKAKKIIEMAISVYGSGEVMIRFA